MENLLKKYSAEELMSEDFLDEDLISSTSVIKKVKSHEDQVNHKLGNKSKYRIQDTYKSIRESKRSTNED